MCYCVAVLLCCGVAVLVDWLVGQSVGQSVVGWLVGWLVGQSVAVLLCCCIVVLLYCCVWCVGWLVGWLVNSTTRMIFMAGIQMTTVHARIKSSDQIIRWHADSNVDVAA
jgi:hypothetical protein